MKIEILPQSFYFLLDVLLQIINDGVLWEFFLKMMVKLKPLEQELNLTNYTHIYRPQQRLKKKEAKRI